MNSPVDSVTIHEGYLYKTPPLDNFFMVSLRACAREAPRTCTIDLEVRMVAYQVAERHGIECTCTCRALFCGYTLAELREGNLGGEPGGRKAGGHC